MNDCDSIRDNSSAIEKSADGEKEREISTAMNKSLRSERDQRVSVFC